MNKIIHFLILLCFVQTACRRHTVSPPPEFTAWKNNPILTPGKPGSWDELFVSTSQVIYDNHFFYLFYMGCNEQARMAVGLATSRDGFHFNKFEGNPVLTPDNTGFDAYTVGPAIILKEDSLWVMYYNCQELAGYTPGTMVARATAKQLTGPWTRGTAPLLTAGSKGEWDDGFIIPCSVLMLDDSSYRLYYTGGREISTWDDIYIGMADSKDGFTWKKYNDPNTTQHPFADSDPVFKAGENAGWDKKYVWMANVAKHKNGFRMYYGGGDGKADAIGYAESSDGIHWQRYHRNPVYKGKDDPDANQADGTYCVNNPFFLNLDTLLLLYYDHGTPPGTMGVAMGK